jgi:hypothetical protein
MRYVDLPSVTTARQASTFLIPVSVKRLIILNNNNFLKHIKTYLFKVAITLIFMVLYKNIACVEKPDGKRN